MLDVAERKEVSKEVLQFVLASEALLSPVLRPSALTQEECNLVAEYVMNLSRSGNQWSKALPVRYNT
ncbi:MAG: hypothetical protein K0S58_1152 [Nitrospira sp.]|jgi:hypothetical protein|nr:hypothetical protein [Nitrospira sp.]